MKSKIINRVRERETALLERLYKKLNTAIETRHFRLQRECMEDLFRNCGLDPKRFML